MRATLHTITHTIASEFSDVLDVAQLTRLILRLSLAALLGALLGWQREHHGKSAGLRTHILVAMGSALFILVAQQAGVDTVNTSRLIQGVITRVGFLGAGAILKSEAQDAAPRVHGLTTAAGIWLTAAIGVCAGLGEETTAVLSTLFALVVLSVVPTLTGRAARNRPHTAPPHAAAATDAAAHSASSQPSPAPPAHLIGTDLACDAPRAARRCGSGTLSAGTAAACAAQRVVLFFRFQS